MPSGEDIASHIYIVGFYSVYKSAKCPLIQVSLLMFIKLGVPFAYTGVPAPTLTLTLVEASEATMSLAREQKS